MNVYELGHADGFECIAPQDKSDWVVFQKFTGVPLKACWRPVRMRIVREDDLCPHRLPGDFPWLGSQAPVFGTKAIEALGNILDRNGELLPLDCQEGPYYAYNVTRVLDALDLDRSDILKLDDGLVFGVRSYVFHSDILEGAEIFKLKTAPLFATLVTDTFVKRIQEGGLCGFDFRKVG